MKSDRDAEPSSVGASTFFWASHIRKYCINFKMELTRIINPVGQGGFYTEILDNGHDKFTVVYDCGGTNQQTIKTRIDRFMGGELDNNRSIDAVFISHFHYDHINGLDYLLKKSNVKYLILPQLTDEMLLEVMAYNNVYHLGKVNAINAFLLSVYGDGNNNLYYDEAKIVKVDAQKPEQESRNEKIDLKQNLYSYYSIPSGTRLTWGEMWLYIPYNPVVKCSGDFNLHDLLCKELGVDDISWQELPILLQNKNSITQIKSIYRKVFGGNHNAYSMTLYSGVERPDICCFTKMLCGDCLCRDYYCHRDKYGSPNCLYTGDYEMKHNFIQLKQFYGNLWKTIDTVQVPHHGSRNNYIPGLYKYVNQAFISVGNHNKFNHPNIDTILGIYRQQCLPIIVSEDVSTEIIFNYHD